MNFCKLISDWSTLDDVTTVHQVTAYHLDKEGSVSKIFKKDVQIFFREEKLIVSFGGPCEYYYDDIINYTRKNNGDPFCIDAGGRNHGVDGPVLIRRAAMMKILAIAAEAFEDGPDIVIKTPKDYHSASESLWCFIDSNSTDYRKIKKLAKAIEAYELVNFPLNY